MISFHIHFYFKFKAHAPLSTNSILSISFSFNYDPKSFPNFLEADTSLGLLITTKFEGLATLQNKLMLVLANSAFQTQDNLLGSLGFLVEDGLGLTTVTALLAVVTALSLSENGSFTGLVLGNFVGGVTTALLTGTEGFTSLRDVDLCKGKRLRCIE